MKSFSVYGKSVLICSIVMEFADDRDVFQKILEHQKKKTLFEEEEVWRIFIQVVKGLKSLHDLKIMH